MFSTSTINNIEFIINPSILWIGFAAILIITAIISIILFYHWTSYGYKPVKTGFAGTIYFVGVLVFLGVIFFALVSYTTSI